MSGKNRLKNKDRRFFQVRSPTVGRHENRGRLPKVGDPPTDQPGQIYRLALKFLFENSFDGFIVFLSECFDDIFVLESDCGINGEFYTKCCELILGHFGFLGPLLRSPAPPWGRVLPRLWQARTPRRNTGVRARPRAGAQELS